MLTLDNLEILSYGAGTPSTTLVGMACENAMRAILSGEKSLYMMRSFSVTSTQSQAGYIGKLRLRLICAAGLVFLFISWM